MTKRISLIVAFLTFIFCPFLYGQSVIYVSHYIERDHIKKDTLIDEVLGYRFIIDKERVTISAIDRTDKLIWKTDPAVDNKLEEYRVKRPTLVYFGFGSDQTENKNEVIWISYNNSQFGYLDKKTGKFNFCGQD